MFCSSVCVLPNALLTEHIYGLHAMVRPLALITTHHLHMLFVHTHHTCTRPHYSSIRPTHLHPSFACLYTDLFGACDFISYSRVYNLSNWARYRVENFEPGHRSKPIQRAIANPIELTWMQTVEEIEAMRDILAQYEYS